MPKLWNETLAAHRHTVREALLDTTATLVAEHGLASVTMSQIAGEAGVARATLYKYFPDVDAILAAWHERHVNAHLQQLADVRDQSDDVDARLEAVLQAYAFICAHHDHHGSDLATLLHRREHVAHAQRALHDLVRDLLAQAAGTGDVRDDIAADELASYCLHALAAANSLHSDAAVHRLLTVTLDGLRPEDGQQPSPHSRG